MLELIHLISNFVMLGVILIVQFVHYPTFHFVERNQFREFEIFHSKTITYIVFPTMTLELISAIVLFFKNLWSLNFILLFIFTLLIWLSTFFLSVPCHAKLSKDKDTFLIDKLIKTNWPRTILWVLKSGVILWIFHIKYLS